MKHETMKNKDITGMRFGKLIALEFAYITANGYHKWLCKCDCGNTKFISKRSLLRRSTQSCGCFQGKNKALKNEVQRRVPIDAAPFHIFVDANGNPIEENVEKYKLSI